MSQDTINEIQMTADSPLKDTWRLNRITGERIETVEKMLKMLNAKPLPNILVLDAGSGCGAFSKLLSDKGYAVVGSDVSNFLVRNSKKEYPTISFLTSDLLHAPFIQEIFSVTFCSNFLHHFQNIKEVIAEIDRVVKVGGEILVLEPNGTNLMYRFTELSKHLLPRRMLQSRGMASMNETIHPHKNYVDVLNALGFKNVRTKFVNTSEQEVKFNYPLAKAFLHTYGMPMGIIVIGRFLLFKLVTRIPNKSLSSGKLIIHAIKPGY